MATPTPKKVTDATGRSGEEFRWQAPGKESGLQVLYVLERFPGGTLNFVYNEIRGLELSGIRASIYSILPGHDVPIEAQDFADRTQNIRPVGIGPVLLAWGYYFLTKPLTLLQLILVLPLDNVTSRGRKAIKTLGHLVYAVYFAWLVRDRREHIHAHFAFKAATCAYVAHRLNGNTFSFTAHGSATVFPQSRYSLRTKIRSAAFVVAVSEFNRKTMQQLCPTCSAAKFFVNRTGVLLKQFAQRFPHVRHKSKARLRIICVATLYPVKNHTALLEAVGQLVESGLDLGLDLVGRDEVGIGDSLREIARRYAISDRVVFHGAVDHEQVVELLSDADLAILTSFSEGVPVSLMEAMAIGVPVVAPCVTGVPELVEDGVTGLLVNPRDVSDIAAAIGCIYSPEFDATRMIFNARKKIEQDFDMTKNAVRLAEHFKERLGA